MRDSTSEFPGLTDVGGRWASSHSIGISDLSCIAATPAFPTSHQSRGARWARCIVNVRMKSGSTAVVREFPI